MDRACAVQMLSLMICVHSDMHDVCACMYWASVFLYDIHSTLFWILNRSPLLKSRLKSQTLRRCSAFVLHLSLSSPSSDRLPVSVSLCCLLLGGVIDLNVVPFSPVSFHTRPMSQHNTHHLMTLLLSHSRGVKVLFQSDAARHLSSFRQPVISSGALTQALASPAHLTTTHNAYVLQWWVNLGVHPE